MREYEIMLILPPDAEDPAVDAVVERITGILAERGGEVAQVDKWGRRRLAYEIAHHTEGYYVVARFTADPAAIATISHFSDVLLGKEVVFARDTPQQKYVTRVTAIHHPLRHVDPGAGYVRAVVHVHDQIDRAAVDSHPEFNIGPAF